MTLKEELLRRIFNTIGILCLILGFCYECRLLYIGTFLVFFVECHSVSLLVEIFLEAREKGFKS